jgi:hypothetical protein
MPVNYTPSAPVAGAARNVSPTEVERWTDYADTIGDVNTGRALLTDSRFTDQRTPLDGSVTGAKVAAAIKDPAASTAGLRTLGTGAQQAAAGDRIWPGQIIASTVYAPASMVTMSTTSLTPVPADATNLSVTFTFPPNGKVVVALTARGYGTSYPGWALTEAGVVVPGSVVSRVVHTTLHGRPCVLLPFTGVAGSTKTWAWALYSETAGTAYLYADAGNTTTGVGQAYMEIRAG